MTNKLTKAEIETASGYDARLCPVGKTLELVCGRGKPVILYLIQHDINRFSLLTAQMPRISRKILTEQLRELEKQNLIERKVRAGKMPREVVYSLTEKGASLRNLTDRIFSWGMENLLDEESRRAAQKFIVRKQSEYEKSSFQTSPSAKA